MRQWRLAIAAALLMTAEIARADDLPDVNEVCTVNRRCSSTGMVCAAEDRDCVGKAVEQGLQVICEDRSKRRMVYCPPDTARSDSRVVWILLALAGTLAVGGSSLAWVVLRKKRA